MILSCEKMFAICVSLKFHKYLNSTANPEIKCFIKEMRAQHKNHTRIVVQRDINLPNCHRSIFQQTFIFESIGFWIEITSEIRSINSGKNFKARLRKFLLHIWF